MGFEAFHQGRLDVRIGTGVPGELLGQRPQLGGQFGHAAQVVVLGSGPPSGIQVLLVAPGQRLGLVVVLDPQLSAVALNALLQLLTLAW